MTTDRSSTRGQETRRVVQAAPFAAPGGHATLAVLATVPSTGGSESRGGGFMELGLPLAVPHPASGAATAKAASIRKAMVRLRGTLVGILLCLSCHAGPSTDVGARNAAVAVSVTPMAAPSDAGEAAPTGWADAAGDVGAPEPPATALVGSAASRATRKKGREGSRARVAATDGIVA
jgi:hypothetical protein